MKTLEDAVYQMDRDAVHMDVRTGLPVWHPMGVVHRATGAVGRLTGAQGKFRGVRVAEVVWENDVPRLPRWQYFHEVAVTS